MTPRPLHRRQSFRSASATQRKGNKYRGLVLLLVILALASVKVWVWGSLFGKTVGKATEIFKPNLAVAQTAKGDRGGETPAEKPPAKEAKPQKAEDKKEGKEKPPPSAEAQGEQKTGGEKKEAKKAPLESLSSDLALIQALRAKEADLRKRELRLKQQEVRLERLRRDIERKVGELRGIQQKVESFVQKGKEMSEERLKRLAKVYESAPPEKAGQLLSELDPSLAALILLRIDGRKAGRIWGFVVEEKAVRISQELTKLR